MSADIGEEVHRWQEKTSCVRIDGQQVDYDPVAAHSTVFNFTGRPAVVLPYTRCREGLPIEVQLVGKRWRGSRLLAIAECLSEVSGEFQRPPGY